MSMNSKNFLRVGAFLALFLGVFALSGSPVLASGRSRTCRGSYDRTHDSRCSSSGSYGSQSAWGTAYGSNRGISNYPNNTVLSITGTVTSVSGNTLTVNATNGTYYTINAAGAQVTTQNGGFSLAGVYVGDTVSIQGTTQASNSIRATWISDTSQGQYGTMYGTISSWNGTSFDLQTTNNASYVTLGSNVTVTQNGGSASTSNLANGESVSISGTWSREGNNFIAYSISINGSANGNYNNGGFNNGYYNSGYNNGNYNNGYYQNGYYNGGYYSNGNCYSGNCYNGNYNNGYYYNGNTQVRSNSSVPNGQAYASLSFSPSIVSSRLTSGQSSIVSVSGSDSYGIARVNIFVNGTQIQTCAQSGNPSTATCTYSLYANNYTSGSSVSVYGQVVDQSGYVTNSSVQYINIATDATVSNGTISNPNSYASISLSPNVTTLTNSATTVVTASGNDSNGISGINIIVNGATIHVCAQSTYPTSYSCTTTLHGSNYTYGSTISVYAQVLDRSGYTYSSGVQNILIN